MDSYSRREYTFIVEQSKREYSDSSLGLFRFSSWGSYYPLHEGEKTKNVTVFSRPSRVLVNVRIGRGVRGLP